MTELDLNAIRERNNRVENDKAWETSWTRRLCIAGLTYIILNIYLPMLGVEHAYLHATVPVMGYLLSTLGLPIVKQIWVKKRNAAHG